MNFKLISYLLIIFKIPINSIKFLNLITKNSLYLICTILLMDHLHLKNQIAKHKYSEIYKKKYIPLHLRITKIIQDSTKSIENLK